jgi:hypothetical protein
MASRTIVIAIVVAAVIVLAYAALRFDARRIEAAKQGFAHNAQTEQRSAAAETP